MYALKLCTVTEITEKGLANVYLKEIFMTILLHKQATDIKHFDPSCT